MNTCKEQNTGAVRIALCAPNFKMGLNSLRSPQHSRGAGTRTGGTQRSRACPPPPCFCARVKAFAGRWPLFHSRIILCPATFWLFMLTGVRSTDDQKQSANHFQLALKYLLIFRDLFDSLFLRVIWKMTHIPWVQAKWWEHNWWLDQFNVGIKIYRIWNGKHTNYKR